MRNRTKLFNLATIIKTAVQIIVALVFFSLYIYFANDESISNKNMLWLILPAYIAIAAIAAFLTSVVLRGIKTVSIQKNGSIGNLTLDVLSKLRQPVAICDDSGCIVWYNHELAKLSHKKALYGENISHLSQTTVNDICSVDSPDGLDVLINDVPYGIRAYHINSQDKEYIFTIWHDKSELRHAYQRLSDEASIVAYIMVDNFDELMQYVNEKYRTASNEVDNVLKEWADSVNGILTEYDHDRYMFVFEARYLPQFVEERFAILDKVRDIRIGDGALPITLSIGVSGTAGNYAEKDKAARSALDMALQRGGDQAVVRTGNGLEYYGGRSKSVQKRTKVRARVIANELAVLISSASNVLIMGHRNMDFDALGACVGLARLCMFCGVGVHVIANLNDSNLKKCFDKITALPEYANMFVSAADAQDMLGSETLLIIADVNNRLQYESPEIAENAFTTVIIDHHRKKEEFKTQPAIAYIEPSASSACELVAEILEQSMPQGQLKSDEAELMFAGILLDTKQFSQNAGARTFSAALYLRAEGANPAEAQALFKTDLSDFMREARFTKNIKMLRNFIAIAINDEDGNSYPDDIAAAKAADRLLTIDGVQASFTLCRINDAIVIKARSAGYINVQLIMENLGGGGHFDSAACQMRDVDMKEAEKRLSEAIEEYLSEL